jgi:anhydro-N-acetylmuramic acid kinase
MPPATRLVVGLMSGTSADAVDAALIETDGEALVRPIASAERPYSADERELLRRAARRALEMERPGADPLIAEAERMLTLAHAEAVARVDPAREAALVGFHGATLAHRPDQRWTWQAGDAALLARLTGRAVVFDFRSADMAAGGEGAPLAPGFHRALANALERPVGILNIGGVANLTWLGPGGWGAFDTGPGNALLDDWVGSHGLGRYDAGGRLAGSGHVREDVLSAMLDLPWFDRPGPKSLDRDDFSLAPLRGLSPADGAATLAAFTAEAVAIGMRNLAERPRLLLVTGGGRHNPAIMGALARRTGCAIMPVEAAGWQGDALEAQAFAWLAMRHLKQLPGSWPETTGCHHPVVPGRLAEPA